MSYKIIFPQNKVEKKTIVDSPIQKKPVIPVTTGDKNLKKDILKVILNMSPSEFKKAGLLIRIKSDYLGGEEIYLASTEKEAYIGRSEGLACYIPDEIPNLRGLSKERLRYINEIKKIFQGSQVLEKGK